MYEFVRVHVYVYVAPVATHDMVEGLRNTGGLEVSRNGGSWVFLFIGRRRLRLVSVCEGGKTLLLIVLLLLLTEDDKRKA